MNSFPNNFISFSKATLNGLRELKNLRLSSFRKVFSLMGKNEKIAFGILLIAAITSLYISLKNVYINNTHPVATFGGIYSEGLVGQPTYINPLLATQDTDNALVKLVFSGLYKYNEQGVLEPDLAEALPVISEDQKQYTVTIKNNALWHNNKNVTADDVIFTIQTLQDQNYKSPLRALWESTKVEKISDNTIKFTTAEVSGPFVNNLTLPILPKSIWQNTDPANFLLSKFNLEAIGSGPYLIKEIKKLPSGKIQQITLNSHIKYYFGRPNIDQVIIKFFESEEEVLKAFHSREILGFGYTPLGSSLFLDKQQNETNLLEINLPQYQILFFNLNNKLLNDQNVRQAISLATNKQEILDKVFKNNANLPVSPFIFNNPQNKEIASTFDINQAKNLLDQSGWTVDQKTGIRTKRGQKLTFSVSTNDATVNAQTAQLLTQQWSALNIETTLNILPSKQLMDNVIKPRTFDVLIFPQKFNADPDPFLFWHSSQTKNPGFNLTGFSDSKVDKLIIEARTTTDKEKRQIAYLEFNNIVNSKVPIIFLDQTEFIYALDSDVKNTNISFVYEPSHRFYNIHKWHIKEKRVWGK
jgi:peptide/nickel transport system substrate-binding protein